MGDTASTGMLVSSLISAGTTIAGANAQSQAIESRGQYQKQQYDFNSRLAEMQAKNAILRGDKAASNYKKQAKGVLGAQRAALAAQGVSVNEGSALEVQQDTRKIAATDIMTIKNNAWQESWGYKSQALSYKFQGQFAEQAAQFDSQNTLLSGVLQAANNTAAGYAKFSNAGYSSGNLTPSFNVSNTRTVPAYYKTGDA